MIDKKHHMDTIHMDTARELTADELDGVSGGGIYQTLFYAMAEISWLSGCPPTASYAPLCPN